MKTMRKISVTRLLVMNVAGVLAVSAPILIGLMAAPQSHAAMQAQDLVANPPVYEVASIKPTKSASGNGFFRMGFSYTPDGFSAENVNVMMLLQSAYGVGKDRFGPLPDWFNSEHYDIEAKMDGEAAEALKKLNKDDLKIVRQKMLRALLADRFKLAIHTETKDLPIYNLVIAKSGLKMQESKPEDPATKDSKDSALNNAVNQAKSANGPVAFSNSGAPGKSISIGPGGGGTVSFSSTRGGGMRSSSGKGVPIDNLLNTLTGAVGRPVIDKTGLTGKYDYKLEYAADNPQASAPGGDSTGAAAPDSEPSGPNIFTAVQEQLGLKLESGKGPVAIYMIDHVEKPSEN
jgi:uncharacterized protein (TIGR03435 family)